MQKSNSFRRLLYKNAYLLLAAAWFVTLSFIVDNYWSANASVKSVQSQISSYIHKQEKDIKELVTGSNSISTLAGKNYSEDFIKKVVEEKFLLFLYATDSTGYESLIFWNSKLVLPFPSLLFENRETGFVMLDNGYYVWKRFLIQNVKVLALIPVKWNYIISNDYLKNGFVNDPALTLNYEISTNVKEGAPILSEEGSYLFSLVQKSVKIGYKNNFLSTLFRLLAALLVFIFIHICISYLAGRKFWLGVLLFLVIIVCLRISGYFFPLPLNFRQYELFDPSVYGSGYVLRSLGDLLINAFLFIWFVLFIRHHQQEKNLVIVLKTAVLKWGFLALVGIVMLLVSYEISDIIRSMVADSQISFDVINFFSLNIYSIVGFIVLCCLSIGYFFLCQFLLFLLKPHFPKLFLPIFIIVSVCGLIILGFNIGNFSVEFELMVLIWLVIFLFLLNNFNLNLLATKLDSSKLVFWLFFFSLSITAVIIVENTNKEIRNRHHYAEILSTKADPSNETLINTMLTDFREDYLSQNYYRLVDSQANRFFKDSLVNGNFSAYTNKYETRIFTYNAEEKPLFNEDITGYNELNTILKTQTKPTGISGLYYYDEAFDRFSYISKKILTDSSNSLKGYVFILASPRKFMNEALYPELFNRGQVHSIENSTVYAFAIYNNWKLIDSHNDYPFATSINKGDFSNQQFTIIRRANYSELWYYAGANKMIVIAKKNSLLIESVTLFSYLFCGFLILTALFWLINIFIRSRFEMEKFKSYWQLTIRNQVHGTIIFISVLSFLVIGVATILFFVNRYESNNREKLSRTIRIMEEEVKHSFDRGWKINDTLNRNVGNDYENLEITINKISQIHGIDVNLYDLEGNLNISSLPLPYIKGILSTKMEPLAFFNLNNKKVVQYFQKEHIGDLYFVSNYIPVIDALGNNYAYLNIPYFTSESNLKNEISNFLVSIINLNAFIFLIAGIVALFITHRITKSFSVISEKMRKINLEKRNEYIEWKRDDELGALVVEYNKMVSKLEESAMALVKTEREGAWREMARQVAHEIKNPLTPMKLSMQFLQNSIESNAPNVKELSLSVARTLVEQIDHLSQIAGEFSQFANIENPKKEYFELNDAIETVLHLYAASDQVQFVQRLLPQRIMIEADKTHINRLFTNLILNAIQSVSLNRQAIIEITETIQDDYVIISITDNGKGIPEEISNNIFTPNFTTKTSGTGLGLAMCKRMVEQAKGKIWFESKVDEGTTFFVSLPVAG